MQIQNIAFICFAAAMPCPLLAQSDIDPMDAVLIIEGFEEKIAYVEYEIMSFETLATEAGEGWAISKPTIPSIGNKETGVYSNRTRVAFSPAERWFLVKSNLAFKSVFKAQDSVNDIFTFNSRESMYSSDGDTLRLQVIGDRYKEPPTTISATDTTWGGQPGTRVENFGVMSAWDSHSGYIGDGTKDAIEMFGNSWGFRGVGCMAWTDFESPILLSKFIRMKIEAGEKVIVREKSKGVLEIYCEIQKSHTFPYAIKFFFDSARGRVHRVEWGGCEECDDTNPDDWWANRIGLLEYDDNSTLPSVLNQIELPFESASYTRGMKCKAHHVQFTQRRISAMKKEKGIFSFDFAPGVELSDYINKRVYIVGKGLEDDIASTEKFMQLNGLIQSEHVAPRNASLWSLLVICFALVFFAVFAYRKRFVAMLIGCAAFGHGHTFSAIAFEPKERVGNTTAVLTTPISRQCGHLATAAACTYFQVAVNASILESVMTPTERGTSLLQIKNALELHGLKTKAQKCDSLRSLTNLVSPDRVAVVPFVMPNGRGHYGIVIQKKRGSEHLLVDVLTAVVPITNTRLSDEALSYVSGVVLIVSKPVSPTRPIIKCFDTVVRLGDIAVDDPASDTIDFEVNIKNDGDQPELVGFRTSCGCIQPKDSLVLIHAKGSHSARFFISRGGWGLGEIERFIEIEPANGQSFRVSIIGRGIRTEVAENQLAISTQQLMLHALPYTDLESIRFTPVQFKISGTKELLEKLKIASEYDWVTVTKRAVLTNEATGLSELLVDIQVVADNRLCEKLKDSSRQFSSVLQLSTSSDKQPLDLKVTIVRPPSICAEIGATHSLESEYQCNLELRACNSAEVLEILEFHALGARVPLSIAPTDNAHQFSVRWPKECADAFSGLVKIKVNRKWGEESLIVSVSRTP